MISIIIPCYNREKTIKDAIFSVLEQTYSDIELIVVDDCSLDESVNIINNIANCDSRIKLIELEKNSGANYARNVGISKSKGEFIAFQDSDDLWHKDKLSIQMKELMNNNGNIIGSSMSDDKAIKDDDIAGTTKVLSFNDFLPNNIISTQTILAKRVTLLKYMFDEKLPRFQDWELLLRISKNEPVLFYTGKLVVQHISDNSITTNNKAGFDAIEMIKATHKDSFELNKRFRATYYYYKGILSCLSGLKKQGMKYFFIAFFKYPYFQILKTAIKFIIKNN
ncbi:glycosyltransferase family 2 protein [Enterococcus avium]|uniref:glycosyltransferase family 2 protein n=1 Tax=Enterococcus avium TaxID=33945 RepID=UPI0022E90181|nr:glycosyltransferase family 2 protein [Enterococcus avium]